MKYVKRVLYYFCYACRPHKSRTVRYAFPLIFTTISLIGASLILPSDASYIRIESDQTDVEAGETFSIDVFAGAHVPVNAVNIALTYPTDSIEVKSIDTGQSVITIWTEDPYAEGGKVYLSGGTFRKGFLGEHLIATIRVKALSSGKAEFLANDITMLAGDGSGTTVATDTSGAESLVVYVDSADGVITANARVIVSTDIDGDGKVALNDVLAFMGAWSIKDRKYDFNDDNRMNFTDFAIILSDSFYK